MAEKPTVSPGDSINIGTNSAIRAVVCQLLNGTSGDLEVVYLDNSNRAINENVKWTGTHWKFVRQGPGGGYADNYPRLTQMEVHELVIEMKLLERRMTLYEEKYGVLSEDFYAALMAGELAEYDAHDETRADFSRWKGIYETWRRRKEAYQKKLQEHELAELLRFQPAY